MTGQANKTSKKITESRLLWIIVSLVISLALWVYVTASENDEVKQTFRGVRVELVGESVLKDSKGMVVTDLSTSTVNIEVTGPRRIVTGMSASDITAQIDVSKLSQAAYASLSYTINYPNGTDTSNLLITRKIPETVNFMVSKVSEKTIPVRGSFDGSTALGYTAETPVFEPSTITVSGPESYLKDIDYAWVSFGEENISTTCVEQTGFTLMDSEGNEVGTDGLTFSSDIITATMPILETKRLKLDVNIIDTPGITSSNIKVTIEPEFITLAGDSAVLDGMNNVPIGTIDPSDFKTTNTYTFPIVYDNSLKCLTGETEAEVTVEIIGLSTDEFTVSDLQVINMTEGYTYEILTKSIDVVLRGTEENLANIDPANIRAVADLTDYDSTTGNINPEVKIYVDGFTDVGAVGDYTINIEIRKG